MEVNVPEWLEHLQPGATEEEIAEAERVLGVRFPEDFRESLKIRNGEDIRRSCGIYKGMSILLPLEDILREWKELVDWGEWREGDRFESVGPVKECVYHERWIPFLVRNWESYHALDLDPDEGGTMGQVITHDTHEDVHYVKARSFREWLEQYVTDLENGKYQVKRSVYGIFLEER